jgi:hypothetical protein
MNEEAQDPYINSLKATRQSTAVLKVKLASIRSSNPKCLVFAFEGDNDKSTYYQWVKRIRAGLTYEPFPCGGKRQVLEFREMLRRDLGDLAERVFFFIDRDFDDYRGFDPEPATTFMTDRYSVENYLVTRDVLEELLKDEFHCHAEPNVRKGVLDHFDERLAEFLACTKAINFRLFVARRKKFELTRTIPNRINNIAQISLDSIQPAEGGPEQIIAFEEQLDGEEEASLLAEFEQLDPRARYRGKFAHMFLMRTLELMAADRRSDNRVIFARMDRPRPVNVAAITIGMLASKSAVPEGLPDFIQAVQ